VKGGLAAHRRIEQDGCQGRNRGLIPKTDGADPMSTATAPAPPATPPLHRITVGEYEKITEAGALEDPSRVELIDGYMVDKMAKNAGHSYSTKETLKALESRLPAGWTSRKEEPVRIPPYDEPEPDIAIVRGTDADYEFRPPRAADVALLVEVSEATLSQDRGKKLLSYAKARIPVYWIINLVNRQVEVYSRPGKTGYRSRQIFVSGEQAPLTIGGQDLPPIPIDSLLPRLKPTKGKGRPKGNGA
jgi:Uma2 family endonuclease